MSDTFDEADFYSNDEGVGDEEVTDIDIDDSEESEDIAPDDVGQGGAEDEAPDGATPEPSEDDVLDLSQFADKKIKVTVAGEERLVPVADIPNGVMMQADYTRKTQEVAEQRQQIAFWQQVEQAMRVNPTETLDYLGRQFGAQTAQQAAALANDDDWNFDDTPAVDPRFDQLRQELSPVIDFVEQQRAVQTLDQVVRGLTTKYGNDPIFPFDPNAVISEAVNRNTFDPNDLETVYRDMALESYRAQVAAQTQFGQQKAGTAAQRAAAAQAAAAVIGQGGSASGGRESVQPPPPINSVADAVRAAIRELEEAQMA